MFSLAAGFLNWALAKQEVNILVVGLPGSGKTLIMEQQKRRFVKGYRGPSLDAIQTTMGMNLARLPMGSCSVTWWDVGGSMPGTWDRYYADADGVIFVVDAADLSNLPRAGSVLASLIALDPDIDPPVLVLANKSDILGAASVTTVHNEVCRASGLVQSAGASGAKREYRLKTCSAKRDEGLAAAIDWIVQAAKLRCQQLSAGSAGSSGQLGRLGLC